jgi:hypothetical protein
MLRLLLFFGTLRLDDAWGDHDANSLQRVQLLAFSGYIAQTERSSRSEIPLPGKWVP